MSSLPTGQPHATAETKPYWDATGEGRIDLPRCKDCDLVIWYPREFCPDCQTSEVEWQTMSGKATVYSYTVTRAGVGRKWREHTPFVVAYVQLDEGPIMLTNIVDVDPDTVSIGMAVTAVFDAADVPEVRDGDDPVPPRAIVRFTAA